MMIIFQLGLERDDLLLSEDDPSASTVAPGERQPKGNLTVSFNTPRPKVQSFQSDPDGRILVRVITAEDELLRLRESGDEVAADKLERELAQHQQRLGDGDGASEIGVTVTLPSITTTTAVTEDDSDMWSTKTTESTMGLEIASQTSTTTTPTSPKTSPTSITTTTSEPPTTTFSPTASTTTTPHLITDTPQPDPAEDSQQLIPNRSPPGNYPTTVNDPPKTFTTKTPFPVSDILKKYAHVRTLNKLVEQFRDQNSETLSKGDEKQGAQTPVDPEKLQ